MDFENIAAGAEKEGHGRFDVLAVMTRLKEKGRILIARSYGDWGRFAKYKQAMLEHSIQSVELTSYRGQEKNRADIALAVDAMELAFRRDYIDTFVLLSGDSDFTPLVMRLRELNRRVIGIGTRRSSSRLLVESCDEFIFYESIIRGRAAKPVKRAEPTSDAVESLARDEALTMLVGTIEGLQKDEAGPLLAGRVKQSLLRKAPTFDESEYGYAGFARFLEVARDHGLVVLSQDDRAGGYRVDLPGDNAQPEASEPEDIDEGPALPGEAGRLREVLVRAGVDPLDAMRRHVAVHEFVDHVSDRARKKKRNTLIYTVGDVARRCRQTDPAVRPSQVRSVLQAIYNAGELIHADGNPIRRESAPFSLRGDGEEILRVLRGYYVRQLLESGEKLSQSRPLSILLWGDEDHATASEELVAWASHELAEAMATVHTDEAAEGRRREEGESRPRRDREEGEVRPRRDREEGEARPRRDREERDGERRPAGRSEARSEARSGEGPPPVTSMIPDAEGEAGTEEGEAASRRRRRRRRRRSPGEARAEGVDGVEGIDEELSEETAAEAPVAAVPVEESPVEESPVVESPVEESPAPKKTAAKKTATKKPAAKKATTKKVSTEKAAAPAEDEQAEGEQAEGEQAEGEAPTPGRRTTTRKKVSPTDTAE